MRATAGDWARLTGLGLIWGGAFMMTRIATADFTPFTLAGVRLTLAAAVLHLVLRLRGIRLPRLSEPQGRAFWLAALAVAFLANAMPFTSLAWSQRHVDSALAGVLMATVPLFVLPLAHLFVPGERMTLRRAAGFVLGFAGVAVLAGPPALAGFAEAASGPPVAALAIGGCLLAALGYASGSITARLAPPLGLLTFATAALTLAAAMILPLAVALESPLARAPSIGGLLAMLYLGVVATALANVMLLATIRSAGPGFTSNVNYQIPVWAVIFGTLLMDERPSPGLALGLVLVLAGLAVAQNLLGLRRGGHARG